ARASASPALIRRHCNRAWYTRTMSAVRKTAVHRMTREQCAVFFERLKLANPQPESELEYTSPFELLVAVVLSAQATDASVNRAVGPLFAYAHTPRAMVELGEERLALAIKTIGL